MSASWCFPCKAYAPTFIEVSKMDENKGIEFKEFDADNDEELFEKYQVRSVPTTVFLDENDCEIYKLTGNISKTDLLKAIETVKNG